jgi:hypothetical protein
MREEEVISMRRALIGFIIISIAAIAAALAPEAAQAAAAHVAPACGTYFHSKCG